MPSSTTKDTRRFLELMGNPPRDGHYMIAPADLDWFAVFSFDPVGYVKDDEKIDADALLKSLKESDGPGNEERKRLGMEPIYTDGWHVPPHYDTGTKRLEWGMRLRDEKGRLHVNYTSRLLGRSGVMSAVLVSSPQIARRGHEGLQRGAGRLRFRRRREIRRVQVRRQDRRVRAWRAGARRRGGGCRQGGLAQVPRQVLDRDPRRARRGLGRRQALLPRQEGNAAAGPGQT